MKNTLKLIVIVSLALLISCKENRAPSKSASEFLGNPEYQAISYGGYRGLSRNQVPTIDELKEDMRILSAIGIKVIRTYNTTKFKHTEALLEAIQSLRSEDPSFEMYVMLGAWIECQGAFTPTPDHTRENEEGNAAEIAKAIEMAKTYPDIVKIIAVGNESMVQWAASYFVRPKVVLKWVTHLQGLKSVGALPSDLWITSSDNFASWGGGEKNYHTEDLTKLIQAVDYVSMHTYPFHDTYYNSTFWIVPESEDSLSKLEKIDAAMLRAFEYAQMQYMNTSNYIKSIAPQKLVHIGETGWATVSSDLYGPKGSQAADEYKQKRFYDQMREWTNKEGISCFFFEAFDEQWKDQGNPTGSENHFGLINLQGQAKFVLWDLVDQGTFGGLKRDGNKITKTYNGNMEALMQEILSPPMSSEVGSSTIHTINELRNPGEEIQEETLIIVSESIVPNGTSNFSYPSAPLKLNAWDGTCNIKLFKEGVIEIATGEGEWWGCAMEVSGGIGENLSKFKSGNLCFEIKGTTSATFNLGFQTGLYTESNQVNHFVTFKPNSKYSIDTNWKQFTLPIAELGSGADLKNINSLVFLRGTEHLDGKSIQIKNIVYKQ